MEAPPGEPRISTLEGSKPTLTVECRGDIASVTGEVCTTRVGTAVVKRVRNAIVLNADIVQRFQALVATVADELGEPLDYAIWSATRDGDKPAFGAINCQFDAIRTSVTNYEQAPPELVASGALCMRAAWQTRAEDIVVELVPALTSSFGGPMVPGPELAQSIGLRLDRATRDPVTVEMYLDARISAAESMLKP